MGNSGIDIEIFKPHSNKPEKVSLQFLDMGYTASKAENADLK